MTHCRNSRGARRAEEMIDPRMRRGKTIAASLVVLLISICLALYISLFRMQSINTRTADTHAVQRPGIPRFNSTALFHEFVLATFNNSAYRRWKPSRGIIFLKTHKTGSSTLTSIFHRLAVTHNLSCAVPLLSGKGKTHDLRNQTIQDEVRYSMLSQKNTPMPFDMWVNHVSYSPFIHDVVPSAHGFAFASIRDPATRVPSSCDFFKCCPHDRSNWTLYSQFVQSNDGARFLKEGTEVCRLDDTSIDITGVNRSSPGFVASFEETLSKVRDGRLLLLVTDRMLESVLVLMHEYDLHPLDASFHSLKVRTDSSVEDGEENLPDEVRNAYEKTRQAHRYDWELYKLANRTLDERLRRFYPVPSKLVRDLEALEEMNQWMGSLCSPRMAAEISSTIQQMCFEWKVDNVAWIQAHHPYGPHPSEPVVSSK
uniref:Sulfotransferase domain-containing protein n=1 Tax=Compsopogon caeruleus TaxID=31354 RepID=A0A7S1T663_9RHOD